MALMIGAAPMAVRKAMGDESGGTIKGRVDSPLIGRYPALVYIEQINGDFPPPKEHPHISQKGMVFDPHILAVLKGTTVDFTNDDTVDHNVFAPPGSATSFNLGMYGPGVKKSVTFDTLGEVPLLCIVHPEMSAFIVVLQNPYFAMTDENGSYEIKNVPPGSYTLMTWDEKFKPASQAVTVTAGGVATVDFNNLTKR